MNHVLGLLCLIACWSFGVIAVTCPAGQWLRERNGVKQCVPCITCGVSGGTVEVRPCATEHDRVCHCAAGTYCPSPTSINCRRSCIVCEHGTYEPSPNLNDKCIPWRQCHDEVTFPGNSTADRECKNPCVRVKVVSENQYVCEQCALGYELNVGVYVAESETAKSCTKCDSNRYSTGTLDAQCSECQTCARTRLMIETQACTDGADAVCGCDEDATCVASDSNGSCLDCVPTCTPGQYRDKQTVCTPCPSGTFSSKDEAKACDPWTVCAADEITLKAGTNVSDAVCMKCPEGRFPSGNECAPWTRCEAPLVEVLAATAAHDAVCVDCFKSVETLGQIAAVKTEFDRDRAVQNYVHKCSVYPGYKYVYGMIREPWWPLHSHDDVVLTCIALGPQNNSVPLSVHLKDHDGVVVASCNESGYECDGLPYDHYYKGVRVFAYWDITLVQTRDENVTRKALMSHTMQTRANGGIVDETRMSEMTAFEPDFDWDAYHIMYMARFRLYDTDAAMSFKPTCEFVTSEGVHSVSTAWLGIESRARPSVIVDNVHIVITNGYGPPICRCGNTDLFALNRTHVTTISTRNCTVNCSNVNLQNAAVVNRHRAFYDRRGNPCHTQPQTTAAGLMYCYKSDMYNWEYASYSGQAISGTQCIRNSDGTYRSYFKSGDNMFFCRVHTSAGWEWASPPPVTIGTFAQYYKKYEYVYGVGVCAYVDVAI